MIWVFSGQRVLRWRDRTAVAVASDSGSDAFDFLFALFANVFQMRDWIRASRRDLENDVMALFRDTANLCLVRDLTNGSKYMEVASYSIDGAATVAREYVGGDENRYVVPIPGGRNLEGMLLADGCIAEIRSFMEAKSLL